MSSRLIIASQRRMRLIPVIRNVVLQAEHGPGEGNYALKCLTIATFCDTGDFAPTRDCLIVSVIFFDHCRELRQLHGSKATIPGPRNRSNETLRTRQRITKGTDGVLVSRTLTLTPSDPPLSGRRYSTTRSVTQKNATVLYVLIKCKATISRIDHRLW